MGMYVNENNSLAPVYGVSTYAPIGTITAYAGIVPPRGWLICNGNEVLIEDYPELYNVIGSLYNDGKTPTSGYFILPDLRECVMVGAGQSTRDILDETGHSHDVYALGEFKDDQIQNITGDIEVRMASSTAVSIGDTSGVFSLENGSKQLQSLSGSGTSYTTKLVKFDASNITRTGSTTHGKQLGVNYIIKASIVANIEDGTKQYVNDKITEAMQFTDITNQSQIMIKLGTAKIMKCGQLVYINGYVPKQSSSNTNTTVITGVPKPISNGTVNVAKGISSGGGTNYVGVQNCAVVDTTLYAYTYNSAQTIYSIMYLTDE